MKQSSSCVEFCFYIENTLPNPCPGYIFGVIAASVKEEYVHLSCIVALASTTCYDVLFNARCAGYQICLYTIYVFVLNRTLS
jgi:hypothetical protein